MKVVIKNKNGEIIPREKLKEVEITSSTYYYNMNAINQRLRKLGFKVE
jgi:hypothetical protein